MSDDKLQALYDDPAVLLAVEVLSARLINGATYNRLLELLQEHEPS